MLEISISKKSSVGHGSIGYTMKIIDRSSQPKFFHPIPTANFSQTGQIKIPCIDRNADDRFKNDLILDQNERNDSNIPESKNLFK